MARVGHASAMADRIMLVWGGDTKVKQEDAQDEGLYILDLSEYPHLLRPSRSLKKPQERRSGHESPSPQGRLDGTDMRSPCTRRSFTSLAVKLRVNS
jgi:hypothetical protein